ncbi:MAG: diphosphate--fructose-6-phosphate 1-phosphotransferase [Gemmatimonadota bacterium]|nr:diphosphate--fructose-6-phosphate 1-phosphotransferase [Gemmatimonadota bacterium]
MAHTVGILVGGGPAPGLNSAIGSAALKAIDEGCEVIGILDGWKHLVAGDAEQVRRLQRGDVSRIHTRGGSILRTSRANPTTTDADLDRTVATLRDIGITRLVTIGGDDTAYGARCVSDHAGEAIRVAHVPKTIDNDLPLPGGRPTFGYETARQLGAHLVVNLMEDALTTGRWFFVVSMGRKAGHLSLGIGKAAGATLTLIPEEFGDGTLDLASVCDILEGAIVKRLAQGRPYGVAVIAEGIGEKVDPASLERLSGVEVEHDSYGNIRLAEIPLQSILKAEVRRRFRDRGQSITITDLDLGYELRCAPPIPFDIDYTRTLGYGAVRFLLSDSVGEELRLGGLVCLDDRGHLQVIPFDQLADPETGKTAIRLVDTESESYRVAREYMLRLESEDLEDPDILDGLATAIGSTPEEVRARFGPAVSRRS